QAATLDHGGDQRPVHELILAVIGLGVLANPRRAPIWNVRYSSAGSSATPTPAFCSARSCRPGTSLDPPIGAYPPLGSWLPGRERSPQPEPWEHAVLEAGHGADPVAGEGEDVEANPMADAVRAAQVGSERRLAVGSRPH